MEYHSVEAHPLSEWFGEPITVYMICPTGTAHRAAVVSGWLRFFDERCIGLCLEPKGRPTIIWLHAIAAIERAPENLAGRQTGFFY